MGEIRAARLAALLLTWAVFSFLLSSDQAGWAGHRLVNDIWTASGGTALISRHQREELSWVMQKGVHVVVFGVLGLLAGLPGRGRLARVATGGSVCVCAEALQAWTTSRSAEPADAVLNLVVFAAGALTAARRSGAKSCTTGRG